MADPVRVPDSFDELQERLRNAWTKGKANGESNTSLMNTSKMFVEMFMQKESQKITPYQQAALNMQREQFDYAKKKDEEGIWSLEDTDGDGVKEWVNTKTKSIESTGTGSDLSKYENGAGTVSPAGEQLGTQPGMTFEEMEALIPENQRDKYGVLGVPGKTDATILEKSPDYMSMSEADKQKMFAAQEQPTPESTNKSGFDWNKPLLPAIGDFFSQWGVSAAKSQQEAGDRLTEQQKQERAMAFRGR